MFDIQKMMDAISNANRDTRGNYHLSLGGLIAACSAVDSETPVVLDYGPTIGREHSYRGYYDDLSFEPTGGDNATAQEVLTMCSAAMSGTYEGYKGGDYTYDEDTPLWCAFYGCCGSAIVGASVSNGKLVLSTKNAGN